MIPKQDLEILEKFINGKEVVGTEEERVVETYRNIGYVRMGMKIEKDQIKATAKLTPLGKKVVKKSKIFYEANGIKNLFKKFIPTFA